MATVGQIYYNVIDQNSGECISSGPDIFDSTPGGLVKKYGANFFTKIGIQAKPGTKVVMNDSKTIMIGSTGKYELDDNIKITSLYFIKPLKYDKDIETSDATILEGINIIKAAEQEKENELAALPAEPEKIDKEAFDLYWESYNKIQTTFIKKYNEGLSKFQIGSNGIYKLPNPDQLDDPINYNDLYNIIVDFIYE